MQEEQAAYRPNRQTQDHICTLRTIIDKTIERNKELYIAFMDISAAYDNVHRVDVWNLLKELKIPKMLRVAIENVYTTVYGRVRLNGKESELFKWTKGLKQGDSLSPLLFNLVMDQVTKTCNNKLRQKKVKVGHWNLQPIYVQALTYADDVVLIADNDIYLQEIVETWTNTLKSVNFNINKEKCKILHVTKKKENEKVKPKIVIDSTELETVEQFTYLGTIFTSNGKIGQEIKNRISQATKTYYQINKTIVNKKEVSEKTKMQIYRTVFLPTLLYGSESWARTTKTDQRITATEMKYLRRVANKTKWDRERNAKIRKDLKVKPVVDMIKEKQLKWYGHVKRMNPQRIVKRSVEAREWGTRTRGRPRMTWLGNIEQYGREKGKTLSELDRMAKERKKWKDFTEVTRR